MPKSKTNKKRKNKVLIYKSKVQGKKRHERESFIKLMQETQSKKLEDQLKSKQSTEENTVVEDMNEVNLKNTEVIEDLSDLGLDGVQQVELTVAPPDLFAGVVNEKTP
jgi:hypothetical protein